MSQQILLLDTFGDYVTFLENDTICTARKDEYIFDIIQNYEGEEKKYLLNDDLNKKSLICNPYRYNIINKSHKYLLSTPSIIHNHNLSYIDYDDQERALKIFLWL